jgi:hypothetical protein
MDRHKQLTNNIKKKVICVLVDSKCVRGFWSGLVQYTKTVCYSLEPSPLERRVFYESFLSSYWLQEVHIVLVCIMTSCCLVGEYQYFGETYWFHLYPEDGVSMA